LKSHILDLDEKEVENVNKGGWRLIDLGWRMHLFNGESLVILIQ
jgi:hypothetical protein